MTAIVTHQASASGLTQISDSKPALDERFLLVQVQSSTLVIPAVWVVEIFRVERSQILVLPFYSALLIGITHHGGRVLPLLSTPSLLNLPSPSLRENTMVVQLGDTAGELAQVGLAIDQLLGSRTRTELPSEIFADAAPDGGTSSILLRPELVNPDLWQPLCWMPSNG